MNSQTTLFVTLFTNDQHPKSISLKRDMEKLHPRVELRQMRVDQEEHLSNGVHTDHYRMFLLKDSGIFVKTHTVEELKAVWKLWAFEYYVNMYQKVIFLDNTVQLNHSIDELEAILDDYQAFVIPQRLHPPTNPEQMPDEKYFLNTGIFHSGCVGFRKTPQTREFLAWWKHRVHHFSNYDLKNGLGGDQLWLTHILSFLDNVKIIKDPNMHVTRVNYHEADLEKAKMYNFRDVQMDQFIEVSPLDPQWNELEAAWKSQHYRQTLEYFPAYGKVIDHYKKPNILLKTIKWLKKAIHFIETYNPPLLERKRV